MKNATRNSRVNPALTFNEDCWLISVVKTDGMSALLGGGHAMLVVEGIKKRENSTFYDEHIGQYDVWGVVWDNEDKSLINKKGKLTQVRMFENKEWKPTVNYTTCPSVSYTVDPDEAKAMINSIREDKRKTEEADAGRGEYIPYQIVGNNHFLTDALKGHNCSSWCVEKLLVAGIDRTSATSKPKKLVQSWSCHVM